MTNRETLYDAAKTIQRQITTLKRGKPIAESKAQRELERLRVRRKYQLKIKELDAQYKAIMQAMSATTD